MISPEKVISDIRKRGIRWVNLQLTDLYGLFHQVSLSADSFTIENIERGFGKLDGSSVRGFKDISESDLVLKPVLETYALNPFSEGSVRFISQVYDTLAMKRFERDPRLVAENVMSILEREGYRGLVSAEPEFYVLDKVESWLNNLSSGYKIYSSSTGFEYKVNHGLSAKEGYYPAPPLDKYEDIRKEIGDVLKDYFGIIVESHHHEVGAAGQGEINFRAGSPIYACDALQTIKYVARNIGYRHEKIITFMPKPIYGDNGSGMHVHVSLWSESTNLFYDGNDDYAELSQLARYFIGGLIDHGRALSAIVSPTVNSYKRLMPGYEAPVYLAWSKSNRSAAIRVPVYHSASPRTKRVEYRPPDPSANPYLAIPAIIMAGLDGIKKRIDPGDPVDENIYLLSDEKRRELGIKELPVTLNEALEELESDHDFLKPAFSDSLIETYIEMKRKEWSTIYSRITPAEIYYYAGY